MNKYFDKDDIRFVKIIVGLSVCVLFFANVAL